LARKKSNRETYRTNHHRRPQPPLAFGRITRDVERFCFFDTDDEFTYIPFCNDFGPGPENLSHIMRFMIILPA
jgi:hypothetical protein